jgi:predicted nucleic acid-binding Zn ribbon protein
MPLHKYVCNGCSISFEHHTRDGAPLCPRCGKDADKRVPAECTFVLRGLGWADDGYCGGSND